MSPTPFVGFGCAGLAQLPDSKSRQELLAAAYDSGIRHFDVARMYGLGAAEGELGHFLNGKWDEVTVATKFGLSFSSSLGKVSKVQSAARWVLRKVPPLRAAVKRKLGDSTDRDYSVEATRVSFETSLRELGTDSVSYLFLHAPTSPEEVSDDLVEYLASLKTSGKVGRLGLATALDAAQAIAQRHPALGDVVQIPAPDEPAFRTPFLDDPRRLVLCHGYLQRMLPLLKAKNTHPIADALGVSSLSAEALGASVLLYAHEVNPSGRVLFFSSSPTRVRETMRIFSDADAERAVRIAQTVKEIVR